MEEQPKDEAPSISMKELYARYGAAIVAVCTTDRAGDEHIGSAFHVGEGTFVTARHVAEGQVSCRVLIDRYRVMRLADESNKKLDESAYSPIDIVVLSHPDANKDVAVFSVPALAALPAVPLGSHLDDWITDHDFVLNDVLVLGFPPIPLAQRPVLVAASGQIIAVVDLVNVRHVHFIISVLPKGGFSGGVVLSEWDFALGVVTSSLVRNGAPEELGYLTVLTVEPILECLAAHGLLTRELASLWDGLFTAQTSYFGVPAEKWAQAFVETDRDGNRTRLRFACPNEQVAEEARKAVLRATVGTTVSHEIIPVDVHLVLFEGAYEELREPLARAREAVIEVFVSSGFLHVEQPGRIDRSLASPAR